MEAIVKITEANKLLKEANKNLKDKHGLTIRWEIKIESYTEPRPIDDEDFLRQFLTINHEDQKCAAASLQKETRSS
jgi:hypothetical protein